MGIKPLSQKSQNQVAITSRFFKLVTFDIEFPVMTIDFPLIIINDH